ncbi:MAG: N-acetylmannosaminyltransferase [Gracilibacter sp. BRH_c7a]|nr:MAG: N-acetylmannosaminyltransferase [Gracilibacter sp. BRH_c7a]
MERYKILGTNINPVNLEESIHIIKKTVKDGDSIRVVTANPEIIYQATEDLTLQTIINTADLVVPDGIGVVWAARQLGIDIRERVTGIDLTEKILEAGNRMGWRIFLLGAKPGIAEIAISKLYQKYPGNTFSCYHGYFTQEEEPEVIRRIKNFDPDILLVGLGAPLQEYWNNENNGLAKVNMGIGGTIDVLSGHISRAPRWIRAVGLEWLYRLGREPSRISRQKKLPSFVKKVFEQKKTKQ